jgi:hypothetical protein
VAWLTGERVGQVRQKALVDEWDKLVNGVRREERIGGEEERVGEGLERSGLVG